MSGFLQAVPSDGFIIHAVPADRQRSGLWGQYIFGPPVCKRIRGRDNQGFPNLHVQRTREGAVRDKPFSRNPEDFDLSRASRRICSGCAAFVTKHEDATA